MTPCNVCQDLDSPSHLNVHAKISQLTSGASLGCRFCHVLIKAVEHIKSREKDDENCWFNLSTEYLCYPGGYRMTLGGTIYQDWLGTRYQMYKAHA